MKDKTLREKEAYDKKTVRRETYDSVFSDTRAFYFNYVKNKMREMAMFADGKKVLELGSQSWYLLLWKNGIVPSNLTCINISEVELEKGVERAKETNFNVEFMIMDGNHLVFDDGSFDFVFGGGILHHLDFNTAITEIHRVLKPEGKILFHEPLGANPVSKITRFFTPQARTKDEKPLGIRELRAINKLFECENCYEQFLSVPCGMISKIIFRNEKNIFTKIAYKIDRLLDEHLPFIRPLFRHVIISGKKRETLQ